MAHRTRSPVIRAGKSIREFCAAYGISRSTYFKWREAGHAPAQIQPAGPRGRVLITQESEDAWKRAHSALAATISAAE
jgi:hypothetical protein